MNEQRDVNQLKADLTHWQSMASTHRQHVYRLNEQIALYGINAASDLHIRLDHHQKELEKCDAQIATLRQELSHNLPPQLDDILEYAQQVAMAGANEAARYYARSERNEVLSEDGIKNLTTEADKQANQVILKMIASRYADHHIISEEGGKVERFPRAGDRGFTWVVDPIDGTINFFRKVPFFCTAVGILHNGVPCAGVIYDPIRREIFFARKGGPAFKEKRWGEVGEISTIQLHTGAEEQLSRAVVATHLSSRRRAREKFTSSGLLDAVANAVRSIRALGCGQLALAYVAQGQLHAFINNSTFSWDQTAGLVIVESAGGVVTDFNGSSWTIESGSIIAAANQRIHDKLAAIVSAIYPFEESDPDAQEIIALLQANPDVAGQLLELLRGQSGKS